MSNNTDSRSVHTDALATLGTIIDDTQKRDAIHLAVIPMQAKGRMKPGSHIDADGDLCTRGVGIVDPFLTAPVEKGQWFWCVIYPRVITSLRHVWTHPAFEEEQGTAPKSTRTASEQWMMVWARRAFEDYVRSQWTSGYACPRTGDGYTDPKVDFAWRAVVALAAQPEAPAEPSDKPKCGGRDYCARMPFCGCGGPDPLADRDPTKGSKEQGLFNKFDVRRTDGSDAPGGKHYGCEYFVLDTTHDAFAKAALTAYAEACRATYPALFSDLWSRYDLPLSFATPAPAAQQPAELTHTQLHDIIGEHLTSAYVCTRVWDAWNVGTMSRDDFCPLADTDFQDELADAILKAQGGSK